MAENAALRALASEGAERVFSECLPLKRGDTVVMFSDEQTEDCAQVLEEVASGMGLRFLSRRVNAAEQTKRAELKKLDQQDQAAIDESRAALISLSSKGGMPYRRRLVERAVDDSRFVGLMPGATLELLAYAINIDYDRVERRCDDLAVAMLVGENAILTTRCLQRNIEHKLKLALGSFTRSPITSTGIIPLGTWGNLPGGETFIAPLEARAEGSFLLNGAYTGRVLTSDRPLLLQFSGGDLVDIGGSEEDCQAFQDMLRESSGGCIPKTLGLAELGIGVNEGLTGLTGNALFDEKKEGTAHVAVGDNSIYGGILKARIHEDFITQSPCLTIDDMPILERGRYVLRSSDWREDRRKAQELGRELPPDFTLQKTSLVASRDNSDFMRVTRQVGDQRKCVYTVGASDISPDLARLYELLPPAFETIRYSVLFSKWRKIRGDEGDEYIRGLVAVLCRHHLTQALIED